jgi:hypothetical protein
VIYNLILAAGVLALHSDVWLVQKIFLIVIISSIFSSLLITGDKQHYVSNTRKTMTCQDGWCPRQDSFRGLQ